MKKTRRALALILSCAMLVGIIPSSVYGSPESQKKNVYTNTFETKDDLSDFDAYYAADARKGFSADTSLDNWEIATSGEEKYVSRKLPTDAKGFWQTNDAACSEGGCTVGHRVYNHYNVGKTNEGMVAELVYTGRKYVNFELIVDVKQVSSISRQVGIGFGKTPGQFFVDESDKMNANGGAYATIERGGSTSIWGYAESTVSTNGNIVGGRVSGTKITSENGTWHTVKLLVEDNTVSMSVKAKGAEDSTYVTVLNRIALKDYKGGYISLMTGANGAFDNLSIEAIENDAETVVEIPLSSIDDLQEFNAYYAADARKGFVADTTLDNWKATGGTDSYIERKLPTDAKGFWQTNDAACSEGGCTIGHRVYNHYNVGKTNEGMVAELLYSGRQYVDFELTVDVKQVSSISRQVGIGFGRTPGEFFVNESDKMNADGGAYATIERGGSTSVWGYAESTVSTNGNIVGGRVSGTKVTSENGTWSTVKLHVEEGAVSMYVKAKGAKDDTYVTVIDKVALKDYEGGYISLMTSANGGFSNLRIEAIEKNENVEISMNSTNDLKKFDAYYAADARKGFAADTTYDNWQIASGTDKYAERKLPTGAKGFWQTNDAACSEGGCTVGHRVYNHYNVGKTNEGMVAELIYKGREYTNFELIVDVKQVSSISRQVGIGFGRTPGEFFVSESNKMNAAGGAYATIERGGSTSLWGYAESTVSGSGNIVGGRVSGTKVTSENGTWSTVKVRVENNKVSMYVKAKGAEDSAYVTALDKVALKDYTGGYISLMTSANGGFANLKITDLGESTGIKVVCVGDSITAGGFWQGNLKGFLSSDDYTVEGFGVNGSTAMSTGLDTSVGGNVGKAYIDQSAYTNSLDSKPDVVVVMLGTNDSKAMNWEQTVNADGAKFIEDYKALIESYQALETRPQVFIALPPTAFSDLAGISNTTIEKEIIPILKAISKATGAPIIDVHSVTADCKDDFSDGIHPSTEMGKEVIAKAYADAVLDYVEALPFDLKEMTAGEYLAQNPGLTEIAFVDTFSTIYVQTGTEQAQLDLPTTIKGYEKGEVAHDLTVAWQPDKPYDPNATGTYIFKGALSTTEQLYLEKSFVTRKVVVVDYDPEVTTKVTFDDADSLKDFTAYYADDAKKGLKKAATDENWKVTSAGILERIQPAGKEYWWSNNDQYQNKGVGQMEYGLVTELLYNKQQYINFELEVDVRNITGISRMAGIGFGRKDGTQFFLDAKGNMNYDGGAYAILNRNGDKASDASIWGYLDSTVGKDGTAVAGTNVRVNGTKSIGAISGWHHVKLRVENGTATMWVGGQQVVQTKLKNYTGGYISLMTSANGAFDNLTITKLEDPVYTEVVSASKVADTVVALGTKAEDITFAPTVTITDANNVTYTAPVTFTCATYDADTVGVYTFIGELDLSRLPLANSSHVIVEALVEVESPEMTERTTRIDFNNKSVLDDFEAYYADDAKKGYKKSDVEDNWSITSDGTLKRVKPDGKEFWMTNVGKCDVKDCDKKGEHKIYEHYGVGMYEYGMMANLIYTEKEFTNFTLDVDVKAPTDITRYVMVGFGQTEGEFFLDENNYMHREGGIYAYLSRSGETAIFGYAQKTVNNKTGALGNNGRVLGDPVDYKIGDWAHMRLVVNGQKVTMYINGEEVCTTALKGYFGGYISLVTNAGAEYDNLKIVDMGDGCDNTVKSVEKLSDQTVTTGIQPGTYNLPSHVTVTCVDGLEVSVAVDWKCDGFSVYKPGVYTFVGTLKAKEACLRNPDKVQAKLKITVQKAAIGDGTTVITFDDMSSLDKFVSTYALDAKNGTFSVVDPSKYWSIGSDGMLYREDDSFHYKPNDEFNKIASLTYKEKTYTSFELNVDYVHGSLTSKWPMVAFGQEKAGTFAYKEEGGILAYVEREGQPVFWGDVYEGNSRRIRNTDDKFPGYQQKDGEGNLITHHMRLVVSGGYAYMYIDDYEPIITQLPDTYDGGYISLICNTNVKYDNLMITDLADGRKQTIVSVERFGNQALDGVVELPRFLTVTTDAGYQYKCPVTWASPDFNSKKSGTYNFIATLTMPFENLVNPNNIKGLAKVKHTVDYNPATTVKYYFDNVMDLTDFECFYAKSVDTGFSVVNPTEKFTITEDGWLYRINENFSRQKDPKDEQTDKIAMLTYKGGVYENFEINVDIKNGKKTYFWPMIAFGQEKAGTFVTQDGGGFYAYTEREGRPIFWGPVVNINHEKDRLRPTELWYDNYEPYEEHHLRLVVLDGVASLYVDDYKTPLVAQLPEDYVGGYVSLVCGANDVSFNNFSITRLDSTKAVEFDDEIAVDLLSKKVAQKDDAEQVDGDGVDTEEKVSNMIAIVLACAIGVVLVALIGAILIVILNKKRRKEEEKNE